MIDDMEDGDGKLCPTWAGAWRVDVATPGGATTTPAAGAISKADDLPTAEVPADRQALSTRALHFTGAGFGAQSIAAATLGAGFAAPQSVLPYKTLQLWTKATEDVSVRVNLAVGTDLVSASRWGSAVAVGSAWSLVVVDLANMTQDSGAPAAAPDLSSVLGVEVTYANFIKDASGSNPAAGAFDLWIDDVSLAP